MRAGHYPNTGDEWGVGGQGGSLLSDFIRLAGMAGFKVDLHNKTLIVLWQFLYCTSCI